MAVKIDDKAFNEKFDRVMNGVGIDMVAALRQDCPRATGWLSEHIWYEYDSLTKRLRITMPAYARHVEWGRAPMIDPPTLKDIKEWCKAKGIDERWVYPIWKHLIEHGTRPQPFIRPYVDTKLKDNIVTNMRRHGL